MTHLTIEQFKLGVSSIEMATKENQGIAIDTNYIDSTDCTQYIHIAYTPEQKNLANCYYEGIKQLACNTTSEDMREYNVHFDTTETDYKFITFTFKQNRRDNTQA